MPPQPDEVYFCGKCRRQQLPSEGERCKLCGRITVSWFTGREGESDALWRWRQLHGEPTSQTPRRS